MVLRYVVYGDYMGKSAINVIKGGLSHIFRTILSMWDYLVSLIYSLINIGYYAGLCDYRVFMGLSQVWRGGWDNPLFLGLSHLFETVSDIWDYLGFLGLSQKSGIVPKRQRNVALQGGGCPGFVLT
jgi:hypothetical protein